MNVTQDTGLIAAKTRLTNIQADIAEIKRRALAGEYLPAERVKHDWDDQVTRIKTRLMAVPARLAGMIAGRVLDHAEAEQLATQIVNEALIELASYDGGRESVQ